jgi:hypothetical protein
LDYENQTEISDDRVKMANACMLHYRGDPRWLARFCGNEFTDEHRDIEATLREIEPHVDKVDYVDIKRILVLETGTPAKLDLELLYCPGNTISIFYCSLSSSLHFI